MQEYQKRVIKELEELTIKLENLRRFTTTSEKFIFMDREDQLMLRAQLEIMGAYATILEARIERFERTE